MTHKKKKIVVVCPGRGSYSIDSLGYLKRMKFRGGAAKFLAEIELQRRTLGQRSLRDIDGDSSFDPQVHGHGEYSVPLTYAIAIADFLSIDPKRFDIVAVTGNSLGWYLALTASGSMDLAAGYHLVNVIGSMPKDICFGGQLTYPVCDQNWMPSSERRNLVESVIQKWHGIGGCEVYKSVDLGAYWVLGVNEAGRKALLRELPKVEDYSMQVIDHCAYHTPMMREIQKLASSKVPLRDFHLPLIPMIDGRGFVWHPNHTKASDLYSYTFTEQMLETYDFAAAIARACEEFDPDHLVLLGPGGYLKRTIGQILVSKRIKNFSSKEFFYQSEGLGPFVLSMTDVDLRERLLSSETI